MNKQILGIVVCIVALQSHDAFAGSVTVSTKLAATGTPVATDNPPCEAAGIENSKNLAEALRSKGSEAIGKATASMGLGNDPFNERRINNSVCKDLCATLPLAVNFTAEGSITPIDWRGKLSSELPETKNPGNWAALSGPLISQSSNLQVVCYVAKNWSHNQERYVGVKLTW